MESERSDSTGDSDSLRHKESPEKKARTAKLTKFARDLEGVMDEHREAFKENLPKERELASATALSKAIKCT